MHRIISIFSISMLYTQIVLIAFKGSFRLFSSAFFMLYHNFWFTQFSSFWRNEWKWSRTWLKISLNWLIWLENEWHLCLVAYIFTKLLQNVCLINKHVLMYWQARFNCKTLDFLMSFSEFSYIIDIHSCLNYCIISKLSHTVCRIDTYISCVDMPDVTAGYGRFFEFIAFFENFHILQHIWNVISSSNFHKLWNYVPSY